MVGYATVDTLDGINIPLELFIARDILQRLWSINEKTRDAKSQVTLRGDGISSIVISAERITKEELVAFAEKYILPDYTLTKDFKLFTNEAGEWSNG